LMIEKGKGYRSNVFGQGKTGKNTTFEKGKRTGDLSEK